MTTNEGNPVSLTVSSVEGIGTATALNEGFQAALLVAAGIVVVAVVLHALFARGSRPAPSDTHPATEPARV